jgi:hypothetical protein
MKRERAGTCRPGKDRIEDTDEPLAETCHRIGVSATAVDRAATERVMDSDF